MRRITLAGFILMFFSYAFAPLWIAALIIGFTFAMIVSMWAIHACRSVYGMNDDIYDECLDDVPQYVETENHKLKPIAKIDIHC